MPELVRVAEQVGAKLGPQGQQAGCPRRQHSSCHRVARSMNRAIQDYAADRRADARPVLIVLDR